MFCFEHAQTYDGIKMLMEPHCVSLLLYQVFSSPLMQTGFIVLVCSSVSLFYYGFCIYLDL
jgi:hypothetical protein